MKDDRGNEMDATNCPTYGVVGNVCPYCKGTGQEVIEHGLYGPQVDECPDCDGIGHIANTPLERLRGKENG